VADSWFDFRAPKAKRLLHDILLRDFDSNSELVLVRLLCRNVKHLEGPLRWPCDI
jgi:hypothetical protein